MTAILDGQHIGSEVPFASFDASQLSPDTALEVAAQIGDIQHIEMIGSFLLGIDQLRVARELGLTLHGQGIDTILDARHITVPAAERDALTKRVVDSNIDIAFLPSQSWKSLNGAVLLARGVELGFDLAPKDIQAIPQTRGSNARPQRRRITGMIETIRTEVGPEATPRLIVSNGSSTTLADVKAGVGYAFEPNAVSRAVIYVDPVNGGNEVHSAIDAGNASLRTIVRVNSVQNQHAGEVIDELAALLRAAA